jgi:hypothetical protein
LLDGVVEIEEETAGMRVADHAFYPHERCDALATRDRRHHVKDGGGLVATVRSQSILPQSTKPRLACTSRRNRGALLLSRNVRGIRTKLIAHPPKLIHNWITRVLGIPRSFWSLP